MFDMMETQEQRAPVAPAVYDLRNEANNVLEWRKWKFRKMGMTDLVADAFAESKIDTYAAKKLLDDGCSVEHAAIILMGKDFAGLPDPHHEIDWYNAKIGVISV